MSFLRRVSLKGVGSKVMCFTETILVPCVEGYPTPEVARGLLWWSRLGVPIPSYRRLRDMRKKPRSSLILAALTVGLLRTPGKDLGRGQV